MPRPIKTHVFKGNRYKIEFVPSYTIQHDYGSCNPPDKKDKTIKFNKKNKDLEELTTYLHEGIHACTFDLDEHAVTEMADDLAKFLCEILQEDEIRTIINHKYMQTVAQNS